MSLTILSVMGGDDDKGRQTHEWVTHGEVTVHDPYDEDQWLPDLLEHKRLGLGSIVGTANLGWHTEPSWYPGVSRKQSWTLRTGVPDDQQRDDEFVHRYGHFKRVCEQAGVWDNISAFDPGPDEPFGRTWFRTQSAVANDIRTINAHLETIAPSTITPLRHQRMVCHAIGEFDPRMNKVELMRGFRGDSLGYTVAWFDVYSDTPHTDEDFLRWVRAFKMHYQQTPIGIVADGQVYETDTRESKVERIRKFAKIARFSAREWKGFIGFDPQIIGLRLYRWHRSDGHVKSVGALGDTEWLREAWAEVGREAKANFDRLTGKKAS